MNLFKLYYPALSLTLVFAEWISCRKVDSNYGYTIANRGPPIRPRANLFRLVRPRTHLAESIVHCLCSMQNKVHVYNKLSVVLNYWSGYSPDLPDHLLRPCPHVKGWDLLTFIIVTFTLSCVKQRHKDKNQIEELHYKLTRYTAEQSAVVTIYIYTAMISRARSIHLMI